MSFTFRAVSRRLGWSSGLVMGALVPSGGVARCEDKGSIWDSSKSASQLTEGVFWDKLATSLGGQVQVAIDSGIPTNLTYGFCCGFCSGYALKKVGKAVSVVVGIGFMGLQTLNYYGYINVDHTNIQKDVTDLFDLNKDGKVDQADGQIGLEQVMKVLQYNLPAGGGFAAGFFGGIRTG